MDNNKRTAYLRLMGFGEEANKVVNKAIKLAKDEYCNEVNSVHLLLAILDTEFGKDVLEEKGINYDMLYGSYQVLADEHTYGILTDEFIEMPISKFTSSLYISLAMCTDQSVVNNEEVTIPDLLKALLTIKDEDLCFYLNYVNLNLESFAVEEDETFSIPKAVSKLIEDMNETLAKKDMHISHVDNYVDEMIEILSRKKKANPCLIGEAGVGKTAIAYRFVQRILTGDVPEQFKDTHVAYINSSLLTAGAGYRGAFEERMRIILDWASNSKVILFLDEIHTFINCGKSGDSSSDTAGNMIKKYLSDGSIRIIGATTLREYHKYIETDSAFERRLQTLEIKEPSIENTVDIIKDSIVDYEQFHNVEISEPVIRKAITLSDNYIKNKFLPDKAFTILDQASARVKLRKDTDCIVKENDIEEVVSKITGINVNKLSKSEAEQLISLEDTIKQSLIGQDEAVHTVAKAIRRAKSGVKEKEKPLSFLFVGPTGVGKTELCKVLSNEVAIGDANLIKVDMSEYSEKGSISKFIGSAPGYVGYGEGGQLTEKVKHNPYSIVLLDEIEKAHPEVFNSLLQLLDEGRLTDGQGRTTDFSNCIIVMTSNAGYGAEKIGKGHIGFNTVATEYMDTEKIAMEALKSTFKPEFLNRLDNIVVFNKLGEKQSKQITKLLLAKLSKRIYDNREITIKFSDSVVNSIANKGFSSEYGARNLKREIQNTVEDELSDRILAGSLEKGDTVTVSFKDNKLKLVKKHVK